MKLFNSTLVGLSVATVASLTLGVEAASADLVAQGTCDIANLTGTTDCEGIYRGNDSNSITTSTEMFGKTGWSELWKVDDSSGTTGPLTVALNNAGQETSGTWTLSEDFNFDLYDSVMFVLKGGPTFTAYKSDGVTMSGTWNTDDLRNGGGRVGPGLSHFTVWTTGTGSGGNSSEPTPVPEPAALLGLGSVALASRFLRRKSEDA
ncbi:PEP-CTERM sorting domain-containing protein [Phormidium yuhuli AB48]|uniref:PEP-CTERM sorting domain-containing protein n=1 Tax=Phormidium yuhuli AB48 TaxID=2940671 RepID=A0ABY5AUA9_9CYAN|nr:PEP-CTERM sorting domain-containing protein [Phormidium yuhuli]USR92817.1 PEP-CTERM sorting domain-containing protein [Phormidium yuhuli AB48]